MQGHRYYVFMTGIRVKPREFNTRKEAETFMHYICFKRKLKQPECVECDKHERKYKTENQVVFYINRV